MKYALRARRNVRISMALITAVGCLMLLIPVWPEKLTIVFTVLFWLLLIAAYVFLGVANSWRRHEQKDKSCPAEYVRPPGAFRLGRTKTAIALGVVGAAALIFVVIRVIASAPAVFIDYLAAAAALTALQLRAIVAGRNYRYAQYIISNKEKKSAKRRTTE